MIEQKKKLTSHHEAGHAVVALMLGLRVLRIELQIDSSGPIPLVHGFSTIEAPASHQLSDRDQTMNRLLTCVAGMVAERRYVGGPAGQYNAVEDFDIAQDFSRAICPGIVNPTMIVRQALLMVEELLGDSTTWAVAQTLAAELARHMDLAEPTVIQIVRAAGLAI
ncbi:MAG: M50 family metallopeptidase [Planctomycetia bacterium]|nr:M50 family metallopeptidase [Planctomycetia bacterium]